MSANDCDRIVIPFYFIFNFYFVCIERPTKTVCCVQLSRVASFQRKRALRALSTTFRTLENGEQHAVDVVLKLIICRLNEQQSTCTGTELPQNLVIDGTSLAFALDGHSELLRSVCEKCSAVLCCRLSPIQKAQVRCVAELPDAILSALCLLDWMSTRHPINWFD
jgi:hypothetical protein